MTVTLHELLLYAGGLVLLWVVPGPVWVALTARALSGGFAAAWPLAVGVALGDIAWPLAAIFGLSWILSVYGDFLAVLRWVAAAIFIVDGHHADPQTRRNAQRRQPPDQTGQLGRLCGGRRGGDRQPQGHPVLHGRAAGFLRPVARQGPDIAAIMAISALIPMLGNLALALFLDRARQLLSRPKALRKMNVISGILLIGVGSGDSLHSKPLNLVSKA